MFQPSWSTSDSTTASSETRTSEGGWAATYQSTAVSSMTAASSIRTWRPRAVNSQSGEPATWSCAVGSFCCSQETVLSASMSFASMGAVCDVSVRCEECSIALSVVESANSNDSDCHAEQDGEGVEEKASHGMVIWLSSRQISQHQRRSLQRNARFAIRV